VQTCAFHITSRSVLSLSLSLSLSLPLSNPIPLFLNPAGAIEQWLHSATCLKSMRRVLSRVLHVCLARALSTWVEHAMLLARGRAICERVLFRMQNACISRALAKWLSVLEVRHACGRS